MQPEANKQAPQRKMTAREERLAREAQALRANLVRRKQQQRSRPQVGDAASSSSQKGI